jgi:hypothetical protein
LSDMICRTCFAGNEGLQTLRVSKPLAFNHKSEGLNRLSSTCLLRVGSSNRGENHSAAAKSRKETTSIPFAASRSRVDDEVRICSSCSRDSRSRVRIPRKSASL